MWLGGAIEVLRLAVALEEQEPEVVVGERMAGQRRLLEQLGGLVAVLLHAAPFGIEHAERESRLDVAQLGATRVPLGGLRLVLVDAETFGIDAPDERKRLRLVALGALLGKLQRGQVLALVEGDIGGVIAGRLDHRGRARKLAGRRSGCRLRSGLWPRHELHALAERGLGDLGLRDLLHPRARLGAERRHGNDRKQQRNGKAGKRPHATSSSAASA